MTSNALLFDISEDLIPSRTRSVPRSTSLSFGGLLDPPLHVNEDLKEGCGGQLWPAGMLLAKHLLERKTEMRGKVMFVCLYVHRLTPAFAGGWVCANWTFTALSLELVVGL